MNKSPIQIAHERGWFWHPDYPNGHNIAQSDISILTPHDQVVQDALRVGSRVQVTDYAPACLTAHGHPPDFDGLVGPAMIEMLSAQRCYVPDFAPPVGTEFQFDDPALQEVAVGMRDDAGQAIGRGNWPNCHGTEGFHSASVRVNRNGIDPALSPVFKEVLTKVRYSYAQVGLLWRFIENGKDIVTGEAFEGRFNIEFSFVGRSSGWIGLAIIGTNQGCSGNIWCRYLSTYRPSNMIREWVTLIKHELGHNTSRNHTSGGVMNPSIVRGLPTEWTPSDPSYNWLRSQFGGVPVDLDDPKPPPPPPPGDHEKRISTLESQMQDQYIKNAVQDAVIAYLLGQETGANN